MQTLQVTERFHLHTVTPIELSLVNPAIKACYARLGTNFKEIRCLKPFTYGPGPSRATVPDWAVEYQQRRGVPQAEPSWAAEFAAARPLQPHPALPATDRAPRSRDFPASIWWEEPPQARLPWANEFLAPNGPSVLPRDGSAAARLHEQRMADMAAGQRHSEHRAPERQLGADGLTIEGSDARGLHQTSAAAPSWSDEFQVTHIEGLPHVSTPHQKPRRQHM